MPNAQAIDPWRRRLYLPNYQVREVARYAQISSDTVADWHKAGTRKTLLSKDSKASLSYMQLIEVAVVAAFRKAGASLANIRSAREYVANQFGSEYPFAEYRFKSDGKRIVMELQDIDGEKGKGKILRPDQGGQLAWHLILGRLAEFDYESQGIVIKWRVAGPKSPIIIDPRIAFGAPTVDGTPTWALSGRWNAGESVSEIADDFELKEELVREALIFEGVKAESPRWSH